MSAGRDYAAALERVGGDEPLLAELIRVFFEEYPQFAGRLTQSLSQKDFAGLREAAHALQRGLGYLGATGGETLALAVEHACLTRDSAHAADLVAQLMAYIEALRQLMLSSAEQECNANRMQ